MIDVAGVPQRLEQRVGEAQRHQVLHRFLTEVVVDAVEMVLVEGVRELGVQGAIAGELVAQRLLDHETRGRRQHAARLQALADRAEEARLQREVEGPHPVVAPLERLGEGAPAVGRGYIDARVVDAPDEPPQAGVPKIGGRREGLECLERALAIGLRAELGAGDANDLRIVRDLSREVAVVERRQQLAAREVAGGAEHHEIERRDGYDAGNHD
jgi:hypothetical protein